MELGVVWLGEGRLALPRPGKCRPPWGVTCLLPTNPTAFNHADMPQDLARILEDGTVSLDTKRRALSDLAAAAHFQDYMRRFLGVLLDNGRLDWLQDILEEFEAQCLELQGVQARLLVSGRRRPGAGAGSVPTARPPDSLCGLVTPRCGPVDLVPSVLARTWSCPVPHTPRSPCCDRWWRWMQTSTWSSPRSCKS